MQQQRGFCTVTNYSCLLLHSGRSSFHGIRILSKTHCRKLPISDAISKAENSFPSNNNLMNSFFFSHTTTALAQRPIDQPPSVHIVMSWLPSRKWRYKLQSNIWFMILPFLLHCFSLSSLSRSVARRCLSSRLMRWHEPTDYGKASDQIRVQLRTTRGNHCGYLLLLLLLL